MIEKFFYKIVFTVLISWFCDNVTTPVKEFVYQNIEDEGLLTVSHCKRLSLRDLFKEIKEAKYYLEGMKDLPTTDQVFLYHIEDISKAQYEFHAWMFNNTMHEIRKFVEKRSQYCFSRQHAEWIFAMQEEMMEIRRIYDLMDDVIRCNHPLYSKRIKLKQIKDMTGSESYDKIIMPEIIPLKFTK